ncbi:SpoIIE family protein phosphatase [Streptomyces sp. NPDC005925]|uniref:PP2C family protein-serine/threonine phosphatase n=1 Tax=Streptomyces sp. NPDC005925 TaxID=3157172 RepID=UPI0033EDA96C
MSDGGAQRTRHRAQRAGRRDALQRQSLLRVRGRSVAWVPPLVLLVLITAIDLATPGSFRIMTWIVLVPGTAAALCRVWTTAAFALLSVASYVLVDGAWPNEYQAGLADFVLVAIGGALATLACEVRLRGERRMIHMRDIADTTRRTVLRPMPPRWGGLEHAAVYLAADTDARVGGDFYDIQPGPHGTRVLVGDVQGKGLGAVEAAAALLGTFREIAYHEPRLATVAEHLETRMRRHQQHLRDLGRQDADRFATAVLLGFPPGEADENVVEAVVFGHEPPLAVGPGGVHSLPGYDALPLGLAELAADDAEAGPRGGDVTTSPVPGATVPVPGATAPVPVTNSPDSPTTVPGPASASPGRARVPPGPASTSPGPATTAGPPPASPAPASTPPGPVITAPDLAPGPAPAAASVPAPPGAAAPPALPAPPAPPVHRVPIAPDETLLLFTDGVTEARDRQGVFYPLQEKVARAVAADPGVADPHRLVALVRDGTLRHTRGHLDDDTTVFAVRRAPGAGSEGGRLQA